MPGRNKLGIPFGLTTLLVLSGCAMSLSSAQREATRQQSQLEHHRTEGERLFREGDHLGAAIAFTDALALAPNEARLWAARGLALRSARPINREGLQRLAEHDRSIPGAAVLGGTGDLRRAVQIDPSFIEVHVILAEISRNNLLEARRRGSGYYAYSSARRHYEAALRLRPDDPALHYGLGSTVYAYYVDPTTRFLTKSGELRLAARHLTQAIFRDPDYGEAYMTRALVYAQSGHHTAAARDAERALSLRPGDPEAHFVRGMVEWRADRTGAAVAHARAALEMDPGNQRYGRAVNAWRHAPRNLASDLFAAFLGLLVLGLVLPGDPSSAPAYDSSAEASRRWLEHQQRMHEIHMDWLLNKP